MNRMLLALLLVSMLSGVSGCPESSAASFPKRGAHKNPYKYKIDYDRFKDYTHVQLEVPLTLRTNFDNKNYTGYIGLETSFHGQTQTADCLDVGVFIQIEGLTGGLSEMSWIMSDGGRAEWPKPPNKPKTDIGLKTVGRSDVTYTHWFCHVPAKDFAHTVMGATGETSIGKESPSGNTTISFTPEQLDALRDFASCLGRP